MQGGMMKANDILLGIVRPDATRDDFFGEYRSSPAARLGR